MKPKQSINTSEKLEFNMTPMIDVTFQLLVFFLLTMRFSVEEGNFNIKMPLGTISQARPDDSQMPMVKVRLRADPNGKLTGIQMNERTVGNLRDLQSAVKGFAGGGAASKDGGAEVELDCDYNLRYIHTVDTISALSGFLADDGQTIVKLIEKIKFAPPRARQ